MPNPPSVLFVCTGNICRSPMGERIASGMAQATGVPLASSSAGVGAMNGHEMHPFAASVLGDNGYEASGFVSRYLQPRILNDIDIVLGLTREHRAACQKLVPVRWKRMFTLVEFAELCASGPQSLADIMGSRGRIDPNAATLDIADPMGRPREDFERVYREVEPRVRTIVEWLSTASV